MDVNKKRPERLLAGLCLTFIICIFFIGSTGHSKIFGGKIQPSPRTVMVHLFEWKWTDIAQECENFLGPKGFSAVQVSPPNEHVLLNGFPWYQRYQPVSYKLESRSGTRIEFGEMVSRCKAVGVDIYVDAIINHMAELLPNGEFRLGSGGSIYGRYEHPELYSYEHFHDCGRNGDNAIRNYRDRFEVQNCNLVYLADLKTESSEVQTTIARFLNDLLSLGVTGFRFDAAKHIPARDVESILNRLDRPAYVYQEVIANEGEPIQNGEYVSLGDVTEFKFSSALLSFFTRGRLASLRFLGESWGMLPSTEAIVFVDNHDNQRGHGTGNAISHKNVDLYKLANIFMLAWPYGYPKVMSSYRFTDSASGPPSREDGRTIGPYDSGELLCFDEWICEHRWPEISNMVAFRNLSNRNFFTSNWWSNGSNRIAFGRGDAGFVVINHEKGAMQSRLRTSMIPGTYCDIISGQVDQSLNQCTGASISIGLDQTGIFSIGPEEALVIHEESRLN